ncbi:ABC transporter ATP-binding protein [Pseudonocardia tropica]|uniref:ABC transporter ATP-binding protein n=1 Tax=Pseudonocardia tropica TaxID=681289 RepID=A0ABV1JZW0_9PSEU
MAASLQVVGAVAALAVVGAAQLALEAIVAPERNATDLTVGLLALAAATAVSGSMTILQSQQQRLLGERLSQATWTDILAVTTRVRMINYESVGFSTQLERVEQNAVSRPFMVATALLGMSGNLLGVVTMAIAILAIAPILLPVLLVAGFPAVLLSRLASRAEFTFASRAIGDFRRRAYLRRLLSQRPFAAEARSFTTTLPLSREHDAANDRYLGLLRRQVRKRQAYAVLTTLAVGITLAGAFLIIVLLLNTGQISLAEAGAAAIAVRLLSAQLSGFFASLGNLQESAPFLQDLERFRALAPPEVEEAPPARPLRSEFVVDQVTFRYPEQSTPALHGVTLAIRRGEIVALVGENGSGKTTLAKIIAGLYEPDEGRTTWDGEVIDGEAIRASVSVTLQDFVRYQMTVRDNITISDPDRDRSDVSTVLADSGADEVVVGLDDGADTMLGRELDEGVDLSGGQWQRVAIARCLFRDRDLVVLDEPTAALDPRAESELFADVRQMLDGKAALLISHRLSSVRLADRIYVLARGEVIDSGTHDELVRRAGLYAELYGMQAETYLRDLS